MLEGGVLDPEEGQSTLWATVCLVTAKGNEECSEIRTVDRDAMQERVYLDRFPHC